MSTPESPRTSTRRDFLKKSLGAIGALAVGGPSVLAACGSGNSEVQAPGTAAGATTTEAPAETATPPTPIKPVITTPPATPDTSVEVSPTVPPNPERTPEGLLYKPESVFAYNGLPIVDNEGAPLTEIPQWFGGILLDYQSPSTGLEVAIQYPQSGSTELFVFFMDVGAKQARKRGIFQPDGSEMTTQGYINYITEQEGKDPGFVIPVSRSVIRDKTETKPVFELPSDPEFIGIDWTQPVSITNKDFPVDARASVRYHFPDDQVNTRIGISKEGGLLLGRVYANGRIDSIDPKEPLFDVWKALGYDIPSTMWTVGGLVGGDEWKLARDKYLINSVFGFYGGNREAGMIIPEGLLFVPKPIE